MTGQVTMADRHVVLNKADSMLVAVIDGIGHGKLAEFAAVEAARTMTDAPPESLESLVARCHDRLRATRGAVMSLASLDPKRGLLTWLGVGNVAGVVFRHRNGTSHLRASLRHEQRAGAGQETADPHDEYLVLRNGVVGDRLPTLFPRQVQLLRGDTLVFATDGVASEFDQENDFHDTPQHLAERLLKRYAKGTDDALVLVIRYEGAA
jgi:serine/threonine protein phosphatase PrpC